MAFFLQIDRVLKSPYIIHLTKFHLCIQSTFSCIFPIVKSFKGKSTQAKDLQKIHYCKFHTCRLLLIVPISTTIFIIAEKVPKSNETITRGVQVKEGYPIDPTSHIPVLSTLPEYYLTLVYTISQNPIDPPSHSVLSSVNQV